MPLDSSIMAVVHSTRRESGMETTKRTIPIRIEHDKDLLETIWAFQ
ncbi:MAG: hypothetical protein ACPL7K_02860 [Armatimonadota bacterium]